MNKIDFTLLRELLEYDPDTGNFFWKVGGTGRKIGAKAGTKRSDGYHYLTINNKEYSAHRLAWLYMFNEWPDLHIDHINRVKNDNRLSNLRLVTTSQNFQNITKPKGKNPYLGVYRYGSRWQSRIRHSGKNWSLGIFDTAEEARDAYLVAKNKHHTHAPI
mgnify:CR=1 FL=1|jgi:hypothetical protein